MRGEQNDVKVYWLAWLPSSLAWVASLLAWVALPDRGGAFSAGRQGSQAPAYPTITRALRAGTFTVWPPAGYVGTTRGLEAVSRQRLVAKCGFHRRKARIDDVLGRCVM